MAKYLYAKVERGGKFVLKPADYEQSDMPTFTQLTDEQAKGVYAILENPTKALGATKKAEKAEITRKYGRAVARVLAGKRHGFLRGNQLTPLLRAAAGMTPKVSESVQEAEVVMAAQPVSFDLDSYLQAL